MVDTSISTIKDLIIKIYNPAEHRTPGGGPGGGRFAPGQVTDKPQAQPRINGWVRVQHGDAGGPAPKRPEPEAMPSGWIPEPKWIEGQHIWEARGEALWAAHEWRDPAQGPETVHYTDIKAGDVFGSGFKMLALSDPVSDDETGKKFTIEVQHIEPNGTLSEPYSYRVTGRLTVNRIGRLKDTSPKPLQFEQNLKGEGKVFHADGRQIGTFKKLDNGTFQVTHIDENGKESSAFTTFHSRKAAINNIAFVHNLALLEKETADIPPRTSYSDPISEMIRLAKNSVMARRNESAIDHIGDAIFTAHEMEHNALAAHLQDIAQGIEKGGISPHMRTDLSSMERLKAQRETLRASVADKIKVFGPEYERRVNDLIDTITSNPTANVKPGAGVVGDTTIFTYENGGKAVRKHQDALLQDREEAASLVAHAMGIPAPIVLRTAPNEIHIEFVHAPTRSEAYSAIPNFSDKMEESIINSPQGQLVGLFDRIIGNGDRNPGNWMISDNGPVPIDHGLAFNSDFNKVAPGQLMASAYRTFTRHDPAFDPSQYKNWISQLRQLEKFFKRFENPKRTGPRSWWNGQGWYDRMLKELEYWLNQSRSTHPNEDVLPQPKPKPRG